MPTKWGVSRVSGGCVSRSQPWLAMVSEGTTEAEILKAYPDLESEDIREALRYAAEAVRERELPVRQQ